MKMLYLVFFAALVATDVVSEEAKDLTTTKASTTHSKIITTTVTTTTKTPTTTTSKTTHSSPPTPKADVTLDCSCTDGSTDCANGMCKIPDTGMCVSVGYEAGPSEKRGQFKTCQKGPDLFDACKENYVFISTARNEFYLRSRTECCNKTLCNHGNVTLPKENTTMSNLSCPSCYAVNSKSCETTTLNCTESQDLCIDMRGKILPGNKDFVVKGCATSKAAVLGKGAQLHYGNETYTIESSRTRHAGTSRLLGSVSFAILTPTFFVLLLGKFQY